MEDPTLKQNTEVILSTSGLHGTLICPTCQTEIVESVEEIQAKSDAKVRFGAMILSGIILIMVTAAYIFCFAAQGKILPIPDALWALASGPFVAYSAQKVYNQIGKVKNKTPQ